ncbi:DUF2750 domain-containing protein [Acinetobacter gyllenbergii]|uniref:DUF2750 domain-containing protein n=1 Tax=Acinetobacter gyllenbergii TaxID=134534 RepID=UPI0021D1F34E|nr:DUF2750 domain-containing protein [Acinetobacter gyllenbergii]MCU4581564.1 DUF2750 domain-containing protein [Acinetobacter gyllenbergii]
MHPKQIENIFSLTPKQRYKHFVSKVCDWEELWILEDEHANYLILTPQENLEYLPVWPHTDYAACFREVYPSFTPTKVDLNNFIEKWLQILNDDGIKIGVLPNLDISVWIIDPLDLKEELENELKQYE